MRFYGTVGISVTEETSPGVFTEQITERNYTGDILRESINNEAGEKINPDIVLSNRISIVGDPFVFDNLANIRYVKWREIAWAVSSYEILERRVILSVKGVYNGQQ